MKKDFMLEMKSEVERVKQYPEPFVILFSAYPGSLKFEFARELSKKLSIFLLSNDYVRNYFYQFSKEFSEDVRLEIEDKVMNINNERLKYLLSHGISFVYDQNVNNFPCFQRIEEKLLKHSYQIIKIRIHSEDSLNIHTIGQRKMDYSNREFSVIGDNVFYVSSYPREVYFEIKKRKEIVFDDTWFDFVVRRGEDDKQFIKDMMFVIEQIKKRVCSSLELEKIKNNFLKIEDTYSSYATKSGAAIRFEKIDDDIRAPFFRDVDRIIHALSYTRYADKTQVYSFKENDHISERMLHVQLVSKVARTIGRALNLNCDLIEAIALGHDVGHTPLGHTGEMLLNEISLQELGETFSHNIQGVRHYMEVENHGRGLNLTVQVLDGIMCHNGEMLSNIYTPVSKTKEEFLAQYKNSYYDLEESSRNHPMTMEGCVVRISDIVGYIGRDIEDAIELGLFRREELPKEITDVLGNTNSSIMNTVILDIIENSLDHPYIALSQEVYQALFALKKFNGKNIYSKSMSQEDIAYYRNGMNRLYHRYLEDILKHNTDSIIYTIFLNFQSSRYLNSTRDKRKVIDFIAGMTDDMFIREIERVQ